MNKKYLHTEIGPVCDPALWAPRVLLQNSTIQVYAYFRVQFVSKAIEEFQMIEDGDRLLVCVSGGKDSLSMLHTLHQYQFYAKTKVQQWRNEISM